MRVILFAAPEFWPRGRQQQHGSACLPNEGSTDGGNLLQVLTDGPPAEDGRGRAALCQVREAKRLEEQHRV